MLRMNTLAKKRMQELFSFLSRRERAHAWLLSGLPGQIRLSLLGELVAFSLCTSPAASESCRACASCHQVSGLTHPDLKVVQKRETSSISIDESRQLIAFLRSTPFVSGQKVVLVLDAHLLTPEASGALLKTLEEPTGRSLLFLESSLPKLIPDTLRSRMVEFPFFLDAAEIVSRSDIKEHARHFLRLLPQSVGERLLSFERATSDHESLLAAWQLAMRDMVHVSLFRDEASTFVIDKKDFPLLSLPDIVKVARAWRKVEDSLSLLRQGRASNESLLLSSVLHCFPE